MKSRKCIVHGCKNHTDQGAFVGDLCSPCHSMITTGELIPSDSFLGYLNKCKNFVHFVANDYHELSYEKVQWQRDDWQKRARKILYDTD